MGRPCPPRPLSPPPLVHHRIISIVYRTFHPLSPTLSRKGIRVRMIAGIRIEARLVIDHSPETFTSSFEANIRRRLATILKSRCDFLPPSLQVQSSSPRRFLLPFLQDGEAREFFFSFFYFLTTSSRESSNKARLIFSGSYSNLPLYAAAFLQGGKECRNPSPKGMLLFHGGIRV